MSLYFAQIENRILHWNFNLEQLLTTYKNQSGNELLFFPANALSGGPLKDLNQNFHYENMLNKQLEAIKTHISKPICFPQEFPNGEWKIIWIENQEISFLSWNENIVFKNQSIYCIQPDSDINTLNIEADYVLYYERESFNYRSSHQLNIDSTSIQYRYFIHLKNYGFDGANIYPGDSYCIDNQGKNYKAKQFEKDIFSIHSQNNVEEKKEDIANLYDGLIYAIRSFFEQKNFKKSFIASSGGLDSALVLALVSQAIGGENVHAYLMPSEFSTDHSLTDAIKLSENLGNPYDIIAIKDIYKTFNQTLNPFYNHNNFDYTEENIQARIRGVLMMALSNKNGGIVLNTSNKSEIAMGYSTMYGDAVGALSIIGDVYKSEAYALADYINRNEEIIPNHILTKAPSAELRPDQKDSDSLPDYDLLDGLLYKLIEEGKIQAEDFSQEEKDILPEVLKKLHGNEFKRLQFPPIIKVSAKSFFEDRNYPSIF